MPGRNGARIVMGTLSCRAPTGTGQIRVRVGIEVGVVRLWNQLYFELGEELIACPFSDSGKIEGLKDVSFTFWAVEPFSEDGGSLRSLSVLMMGKSLSEPQQDCTLFLVVS